MVGRFTRRFFDKALAITGTLGKSCESSRKDIELIKEATDVCIISKFQEGDYD